MMMDKQEQAMLKHELDGIEQRVTRIYQNLSGGAITEESLAKAVAELHPDVPEENLKNDCKDLLKGIRSGSAYADKLLNLSEEDLAKELPEFLINELKDLSENEQHQYMIILYQFLCEKMDRAITKEEAIYIANASNGELLEKIGYLLKHVQVELTSDGAEIVHHCMEQLQGKYVDAVGKQYTEEERTWVLAVAMYSSTLSNDSQKVPATLIGEAVGMSVTTGHAFRNCMCYKVIPGAVAALSVAATCALAYFCIKAVVAHSLFTTLLAWAKTHYSVTMLRTFAMMGAVYAAEPAMGALQTIWDTTFTATAALTCRFAKTNSREVFMETSSQILLPAQSVTKENDVDDEVDDEDFVGNQSYEDDEDDYYDTSDQEEENY